MPMLTAPHENPEEWYPGSVSDGLRSLAAKGNRVIPDDLYQALVDAAGRVYAHEFEVNDLRLHTPPEKFIHFDPFFVFNGYEYALNDLMKLIAKPENQRDPVRWRICRGLSKLLHDVLAVLKAEGMDYLRIYQSEGYDALVREFEEAIQLG
ncbi:hypothetical protein FRC08_001779 [Ceratobasidium sp. 394]|nr:hypothetical protein FRC08_001779 [Ceratobasidium sp. 394]KAG9089733.1 hypothetical protein FS749_001101 [Ceratobasidium sp. UAMH 11750]